MKSRRTPTFVLFITACGNRTRGITGLLVNDVINI